MPDKKKQDNCLTFELLHLEIDSSSLQEAFHKIFKEGGEFDHSISLLLKQLEITGHKISEMNHLESIQLEKAFFSAKGTLLELKIASSILLDIYSQKNQKSRYEASLKIQNFLANIDEAINQVDGFLPKVKQSRIRLRTNFTNSVSSLLHKMNTLLFEQFEKEKRINLLHFQISSFVYQKVLDRLEKIKSFLMHHRESWDELVLKECRNLYVSIPEEYPYPIIYTKEGFIFVIQEVVEHFVGAGFSKFVSRTFEMQNGDIFALVRPKTKTQEKNREKSFRKTHFESCLREMKFLKVLKGKPGIIQLKEGCVFRLHGELELFEICELFDSQSLDNFFQNTKGVPPFVFSKEEEVAIVRDILLGLCAIHEKGIVHRDIKNNNILVSLSVGNKPAQGRIIDFNVSSFREEIEPKMIPFSNCCCPPEAAEALLESMYTLSDKFVPLSNDKADIWAAGCVLHELFFGILPWHSGLDELTELALEDIQVAIVKKIRDLKEGFIDEKFHTHVFYPLIQKMLSINPEERPSSIEALKLFEELSPLYR